MQKKVRILVSRNEPVYGITFPKEYGILFKDIYFDFLKSGNSIILTSGTKIEYSQKELKEYDFSDCRV